MFRLNAPVVIRVKGHRHQGALMTTGAFSRNIGKLFSELKLVTDNLLSIHTRVASHIVAVVNNKMQKKG